jgi:dTDP-4-amino-4,6-dideoxygalactose transaminase
MSRDDLYFKMQRQGVYGRRYFYPLITQFPTYLECQGAQKENLPVAHKISDSVICLPLYHNLSEDDVQRVIKSIIE